MNNTLRLQLLKLRDVARFRALSRHSLLEQTVSQLRRQHDHLGTLRIRHSKVLQAFDEVISNSKVDDHEVEVWVQTSKALLTSSFDKIVADGANWNGHGVGNRSLIEPLNDICHQSLHAMLCLDLLSEDATDKGLVETDVELRLFMERIVDDVSSFSKEKFGVCPEVLVGGELQLSIIPPFVEFVTVELLKNAIKAVIDRYGALDIDDAPPIQICLQSNKQDVYGKGCIVVQDHGIGMPREVADR